MTARSGYALSGASPVTHHDMAAEYYQFDWEFGAPPEETSWLGSSWVHSRSLPPAPGFDWRGPTAQGATRARRAFR